ncbi:hypothetical protein OK016_17550 [Vibrio chagasii]|nr:hypothetical protein [Vibrio chagasii]
MVEQEAAAQQSDDYPLIENHETERQQDALRQPNLPVTIDGKARMLNSWLALKVKSLFSEFDQFLGTMRTGVTTVRYNYRN